MVPLCQDNGEWSKCHPCSMDGVGGSYIPIHARDRSRQRHANQGGSRTEVKRVLCELWWMDWTTFNVSASLEIVICQMYVKEMIRSLGSGLGTRVSCDGRIRQLYAEIIKLCAFWEMVWDLA